ncbi:MAG TPA: hypothetical protein VK629_17460 [Steroidobacteraceae bacterium]|nr:hypothetical protein [Steroidobacteraceae bacterium]
MRVQPYLMFDGRVANALAEGGIIRMPLSQTFFAKQFGHLTDRFGLAWMILQAA